MKEREWKGKRQLVQVCENARAGGEHCLNEITYFESVIEGELKCIHRYNPARISLAHRAFRGEEQNNAELSGLKHRARARAPIKHYASTLASMHKQALYIYKHANSHAITHALLMHTFKHIKLYVHINTRPHAHTYHINTRTHTHT